MRCERHPSSCSSGLLAPFGQILLHRRRSLLDTCECFEASSRCILGSGRITVAPPPPHPVVCVQERSRLMGDQDLVKLAKEAVEAFNQEDWGRTMAALGSGLYNEVGTGRQLRGEGEILPALKGWRKAMPDVKGTVTNAFASGN